VVAVAGVVRDVIEKGAGQPPGGAGPGEAAPFKEPGKEPMAVVTGGAVPGNEPGDDAMAEEEEKDVLASPPAVVKVEVEVVKVEGRGGNAQFSPPAVFWVKICVPPSEKPEQRKQQQQQQQQLSGDGQQQQQQPPGVLIEAVSVVAIVGVVRVVIEQGAELRGAELITLLVRGTLAS